MRLLKSVEPGKKIVFIEEAAPGKSTRLVSDHLKRSSISCVYCKDLHVSINILKAVVDLNF